MNKIFTIISLLFIVIYADCKRVSFSDIVRSFSQISQVEGAQQLYEATHSEFEASIKKLQEYDEIVKSTCDKLVANSQENQARLEGDIAGAQESITNLNAKNVEIQEKLEESAKNKEEYTASKEKLESDLNDAAQELQAKALAIVERDRVLRRLSDLLQDNFVGNQKTASLSNFNLDKSLSGYSFVEVHNQMKELKSHDPIVKSMISTLILITQDGKGVFANQESVGKITSLIDSIRSKDQQSEQELKDAFDKKSANIKESISSLDDNLFKLVEADSENRATLNQIANLLKSATNELADMRNHLNKNDARRESNIKMCDKFRQQSSNERKLSDEGNNKFEELRNLIA
jgi:chromosome segregation ATPase